MNDNRKVKGLHAFAGEIAIYNIFKIITIIKNIK